ncbi:MAG: molybdopterin oxidoreductase family protein [Polyangiaceae bacterium]
MPTSHLHTCMLCEAVCGVSVEMDGEQIVSIRGDNEDPFSRGHVCPKVVGLKDVQNDPDRIRHPLRRTGSTWTKVSWDEAIDEATDRFAEIQARHGKSALASYLGNPTVHSYSALLTIPFFAKALGTRARFSATSVDQLPQMLASLEMLGHQLRLPIPDLDRTSFFLVVGANPIVSNGSLMTAPDVGARLKALRARGGKLVVVDPRFSETAKVADKHLFIRPGSDAFLLFALLNVIFAEGLERLGAMSSYVRDLDTVRDFARRFSPEKVAPRTGIAADDIRTLARDFARAPSAVCYGRVGLCTQEFGSLAAWLVNVLNIVTGNFDREGGAMFTTPAVDLVGFGSKVGERGHFGVWKSRVRGLPEFGGELPSATLAEEIETPGKGQIRGLVTFAGNPVLSTPNGSRLEKALEKLDFMVSIDLYRNETTRHANLILPTSFGMERDHYDIIFYALSIKNAARYVKAVTKPPPGVRHDWQVLTDLAISLNRKGGGRRDRKLILMLRALRRLGPRRMLDLLMRTGPHGMRPFGTRGLSLSSFDAAPHGIDLGPLVPRFPDILETPDKKLPLAPKRIVADVPRLEKALESEIKTNGELLLIGRRNLRSNNSWMHNSERLVKGPEACTLLMHPSDAEARGVGQGDKVRVRSRVGEVRVSLAVSEDIARGVVSLPHGWGHARKGVSLAVAEAHAGASVNDLTDELFVDPLSGTASLSGVPVTVAREPAV